MNLLKVARQKKIQRNKDNRDYWNDAKPDNSGIHVITSYVDVRDLLESDILGKNTFQGMDERAILQDVCK